MADKIVRALVTEPTFINGVLHLAGEVAVADLNDLGVKSLDEDVEITADGGRKEKRNLTPGLKSVSTSAPEEVVQVPVAAVAPHAPDAPNPQGIPTGTVQSGTGRLMVPSSDPDEPAVQMVGATAPITQEDRKEAAAETKQVGATQKPAKPSK